MQLPPDLESLVAQMVAAGQFKSANDVVVEGLRLLRAREELRRAVNLEIEQADRGETVSAEDVFAQLEEDIAVIERERGL